MISIERQASRAMADHATEAYPEECCGVMLGKRSHGSKLVTRALELDNSFPGARNKHYAIRPEDMLKADRLARREGLELVGIYHSHPDCDAYFSQTDLRNSCPWFSFVVISVRHGKVDHATCWLPDPSQERADPEDLCYPQREAA